MTIHIESLEISCIIGLLDFERESEQKVVLDVEIEYLYDKEDSFINYANVVDLIEVHLRKEKYELLEEALLGIKILLFEKYHLIESLKVRIKKPNIMPNCIVGLSHTWINEIL